MDLVAGIIVGLLTVSAAPVRLPEGVELAEVDFDRHVASLLGKLGCNAGSCHGSFQGKGGLRLSLFGQDARADFLALTREALGRRVQPGAPERSLLLLKASGQVKHGGGRRFDPGSWQYQVLREWIAQGCRRDAASGPVKRLRVEPEEHAFQIPGAAASLKVSAEFADGTREDVTAF